MTEKKGNGKLIAVGVGIILVMIGVLIIFIHVNAKRYTATITEITDTYTTRKKSGNRRRKVYNETVKVKFVDSKGRTQKASNVRIARSNENSLPKKGETIKVVKGLLKTKEYTSTTTIAVALAFILIGFLDVVIVIRSLLKKEQTG